jgi:ComF family protein
MGNALFFFVKQGIVQGLIQELKYKNKPQYGIILGEIMGETRFGDAIKENADIIIPVPLHKSKENKRGYNQSKMFAQGLSNSTGKPISINNLIRTKNTSTQTKMNREQRIENLKNAFEVSDAEEFTGKHILLVDDVLTTGSTLLECASVINQIPQIKISFATIAMGEPV